MIEDIKSKKAKNKVKIGKEWVKKERNMTKEEGKLVKIYKSIIQEETQRELL